MVDISRVNNVSNFLQIRDTNAGDANASTKVETQLDQFADELLINEVEKMSREDNLEMFIHLVN